MGKTSVPAVIENLSDLFEMSQGRRQPAEVRRVEVPDALAGSSAPFLSLPHQYVQQLGLQRYRTRRARTSRGIVDFGMYGLVKLTMQGRECNVEVAEVPDDCPVLLGRIPLEAPEFVVDMVGQRLLGNPDHGGEHMLDLL